MTPRRRARLALAPAIPALVVALALTGCGRLGQTGQDELPAGTDPSAASPGVVTDLDDVESLLDAAEESISEAEDDAAEADAAAATGDEP